MGQDHVHAEAGHEADDALGHGQGLAVGGRVGPGHGDLLTLQVFHTAELVDDVQHVGHALGGVVHIALEVHQRGLLLQDAVPVALLHGVHEGLLVLVALADEHIVPDADDVGHEGHHVGGFPDGLAVGDLGLLLVQVLDLRPSRLQAEAKEKRVRVELSRKMEMPRPESKIRVDLVRSRRSRRASATVKMASSSSSVLSQVQ